MDPGTLHMLRDSHLWPIRSTPQITSGKSSTRTNGNTRGLYWQLPAGTAEAFASGHVFTRIDSPSPRAYIFCRSLMSSTPFGEHLKREREMRGVSLEEIAAATRIKTSFLEAIENERWDQLPGGVFNRGFIRSIARYLGMDEDSLVAEYDLDTKSNGNSRHTVILEAEKMPGNWRPAVAALLVVALIVAAGVFAYIHYRSEIYSGVRKGVSAVAARVHRKAARPDASPSVPPVAAPAASADANSAGAAPANALPLTLKLEAGKPANVKIVADGAVVFQGSVQVNDVKQFHARDSFQVSSSESSALLLELNGQTVPPIGTPGQPGSVTLTRSDLTSSSTGESH
jgi:cytoskeleton protein RodZ